MIKIVMNSLIHALGMDEAVSEKAIISTLFCSTRKPVIVYQ